MDLQKLEHLSTLEQAEYVHANGILVTEKQFGEYLIALYRIEYSFIEIWRFHADEKILKVVWFKDSKIDPWVKHFLKIHDN
ncbi:hypothetical protein [Persicobacter diffluens]|uniref:Uncharacterized protein n=1 Tax=Persicobacter diffluens TaxID=981 RepID=A0AAN5AK58_9BACT|nr:hypothetical protein PEDI_30220 [Persicobacter diffluens]